MDYTLLLNEVIKKYDYQSVTYQNISVPNGWIVECKLSKKLNGSSYSGISYEKDIDLATKNSARLVYDQISKINGFQPMDDFSLSKSTQKNPFMCKTKKTVININSPLPSRPKPKQVNTTKYQIKKELLDRELDEYMKELLDRDREYIIESEACKLSPRSSGI